jgi:hypothetical protein
MISAFCYSDDNDLVCCTPDLDNDTTKNKPRFTCSCTYSWRDIHMNLYVQFENDETMKKEIQDRKIVEQVFSLFWFAKVNMVQWAFSLSVWCHHFLTPSVVFFCVLNIFPCSSRQIISWLGYIRTTIF